MQLRSTNTTNVSDGLLAAHTHTLVGYRDTLRAAAHDFSYTTHESALATPHDTLNIEQAEAIAREYGNTVRTVILVGIGGSDLGVRAIYDALVGHHDAHTHSARPRLITYGTLEQNFLAHAKELFAMHEKAEELVLVVISKSGTTSETIVNANILYRLLTEKFGAEKAAQRTLVISNPRVKLALDVASLGIRHIPIPEKIGGRFSVFTHVGLVPLALLGIDIRAVCDGAAAAVEATVPETGPGPAAMLAALLFEQYLNGITIHELFLFHPELETLGMWYRQLLAESIGKERSDGTRVGIMPTVAIGSTDLHSLAQLTLGGPKNRFTTFVAAPDTWTHTETCSGDAPFTLDMLSGKKVGEVMTAIFGGVQKTYLDHTLPYVTVELAGITPREIGAFMGLHMAMVMYLGKLFDVNTFDQPAVEAYKSEARRLLTR